MSSKKISASPAQEAEFRRELQYLHKRLATVDELIRSVQIYEQHRPRPEAIQREKTA